ncbi:hypothetical protein J1N35_011835 [Gossypium stocksii]|uniref:DUF4283 domain-containing protein n=1 Tax=Gossypium stocksii TaxID=47602 RepID=A0A9D3W3G8_9ROSI|nr:hypothetical protein J1N35_011835 [Gossypium stocksii]
MWQMLLFVGEIYHLQVGHLNADRLNNLSGCLNSGAGYGWAVMYLIVQLWTPEFNPFHAFPRNTMVWIRLSGLSGFLYKRKILEEIEGLIGKVTKVDFQTDKGLRGKFARMVMCIDLRKPLVS